MCGEGQYAAQGTRTWSADFLIRSEPWMDRAACAGMAPDDGSIQPDIFFPERGQAAIANEAIITCFNCTVREECADYKKRTGTTEGIWAGEFSRRTD